MFSNKSSSYKCLPALNILFRKCKPEASPARQYVFASMLRNPRRARSILVTASMESSESTGIVVNPHPSNEDIEIGSEPEVPEVEVDKTHKMSWTEKISRPVGISSLP